MHLKPLTAVAIILALALSPGLPVLDAGHGAAFAKGEKGGGGGNGGGERGGGDKGGNGRSGDSDRGNRDGNKGGGKGGSNGSKSAASASKGGQAAPAQSKAARKAGDLRPNELGKMNGALNANINAVLAHIRNGQTTNGPVGLLAGLAVADSVAALSAEETAALVE